MGGTHNASIEPLFAPLTEPLTRREREVLALLAEGLTSPEIAARLTLATSSVKSHRQNLYSKLGVNSRRQALTRARTLGLLSAVPMAPSAAPAALPAPHNLPHQVTRFFGREVELAAVGTSLAENRLVTLVGAGGVGKTRLSLQVAEAVMPAYRDGVWLVELAALSSPALVAQQVAATLSVREDPGQTIEAALLAYLRGRQLLLVLDNCEHLLDACAHLADSLLRACPDLRVLATTREPLGTPGEAIFQVPTLPVPDPSQAHSLDVIGRSPAVRLFVDRARLVRSGYELTPHNMGALAQVCQRLDGIPLAIEMAAARVNLLNSEQLAARLNDALQFLAGSSRTALPKHQTLRATIDWSYQLLSDRERMLLRRLSVFAGGCTLEAAEAVCAGDGLAAGQVLEVLASLVAKSMVLADRRQGEAARYALLEMVRQFAQEQAEKAGESQRLRGRLRDFFLQVAQQSDRRLTPTELATLDAQVQAERQNLRLALEASFADDVLPADVEGGPILLLNLCVLWPLSWKELVAWNDRAIAWCEAHPDVSAKLLAQLLLRSSATLGFHDLVRGLALAQRAVEISRGLGPAGREVLTWSLDNLGSLWGSRMAIEPALASYAEAGAVLKELGPEYFGAERYVRIKAGFTAAKAKMANKQAHYDQAKAYAQESIRLYESVGAGRYIFEAAVEWGTACLELREYDEARRQFLIALHLDDDLQEVYANFRRAFSRRCLGMVELGAGNLDLALEYCQAALHGALEISARGLVASVLALAAGIRARQGRACDAARLAGSAHTLYAQQTAAPWEDSSLDTLLPGWQAGPNAAAIEHAYASGQALAPDDAVAYAFSDETA